MQIKDYVIRRLLTLPFLMFGVSILVFGISRIGGSPIGIYIEHEMTQAQIAEVAARYGLDQPLYVQYLRWIGGVLRGDLGWSGVSVAPVTEMLPAKLTATMELAVFAAIVAIALGIGMGTFGGARRNKPADHITRVVSISGASLPTFWFGLMLLIVFYLYLGVAPLGRADPAIYAGLNHYTGFYTVDAMLNLDGRALRDAISHLILPAVTMGFSAMALIARMMRSSLVEQMGEDYVDAARAKGLPERLVIRRHARRNALVPTMTVIGLSWGFLLQGTVVVELIFNWPGIGRWMTDAVLQGDQATIMAYVLVTSVIFVTVNLAVDVAYAYLDRRVTLGA
ncbi:MAG: ABC transporter permease [Actinobacteria bacterium]|jgi:peptide/nickel transport system permease protein|nr:ABC transporter permease [Actinomycetota bacterium]